MVDISFPNNRKWYLIVWARLLEIVHIDISAHNMYTLVFLNRKRTEQNTNKLVFLHRICTHWYFWTEYVQICMSAKKTYWTEYEQIGISAQNMYTLVFLNRICTNLYVCKENVLNRIRTNWYFCTEYVYIGIAAQNMYTLNFWSE